MNNTQKSTDDILSAIKDLMEGNETVSKSNDAPLPDDVLELTKPITEDVLELTTPIEKNNEQVLKDKEEDVKKVTKFLANRLTILEMVHKNSESLFKLPQFKQQFFPNTYKNKLKIEKNFIIKDKLIDLLKAYASIHKRNQQYTLKFSSSKLFTIKDGQNIISKEILSNPNWFSLKSLLPDNLQSDIMNKSFYSSTFNASLHMAKKEKEQNKKIVISQNQPFSDIFLKKHE